MPHELGRVGIQFPERGQFLVTGVTGRSGSQFPARAFWNGLREALGIALPDDG